MKRWRNGREIEGWRQDRRMEERWEEKKILRGEEEMKEMKEGWNPR